MAISAIGTAGFALVEDMPWIDALYMTVITLSTVGFGEVQPLTQAGKLFTIGLITVGVGSAFYLLSTVAQVVIEGALGQMMGANAMTRRIDELRGHVIVCGFGRFGRIVVDELRRGGLALVIVERDPEKEPELEALGVPYLIGSATSDDVLDGAHVEHARAIVAGTASDADNLFVTLSAREKNPGISIHARGEGEAANRRLKRAGADQVISPYQLGGLQIASSILRPAVVDFLEISHAGVGEGVDLEELHLEPGCELAGQTVAALESGEPRLRVVALRREGAPIELVPDGASETRAGDHLVVIGERETLEALARRAAAS
jgi:voltage-gated potassium channel